MSITLSSKFNRRTVIKAAGAIGAMQVTSPFIIKALGETPIKIGMVDPLTGVYARGGEQRGHRRQVRGRAD